MAAAGNRPPREMARVIVIHNDRLLVMKRNKHGFKYYSLPGGGVEEGESYEAAAVREAHEETSVAVEVIRELYEWSSPEFGHTLFFLCEYRSGTPALEEGSVEAAINRGGKSTYEPMWLPISELPDINLLPAELKAQLVKDAPDNFGKTSIKL